MSACVIHIEVLEKSGTMAHPTGIGKNISFEPLHKAGEDCLAAKTDAVESFLLQTW
jgi:hypothetical protein